MARRLTRRGLRILCYHGLSISDEHLWSPGMFMIPETFRWHMDLLAKEKYPVLPLDEALRRLDDNSLPPCSVVITFDDGFYSTLKHAIPILQERGLPATIYPTTYYSVKRNPVFRLVIQYLFWRTSAPELDLGGLGLPMTGTVSIRDEASKERIGREIFTYAETQLEEDDRCRLASQLASRMGLSYDAIVRERTMSIINPDEIRELAVSGFDIQLHTHRHRLPEDAPGARREMQDNRAALAPLVTMPLRHLCYPSGLWSEKHFAPLTDEGVISATTCEPGLNYRDTPRFALRRFLDGNRVSDIEFEAELCGMTELLRRSVSSLRAPHS